MNNLKTKQIKYAATVTSLVLAYLAFGYFIDDRTNIIAIWAALAVCFTLYFIILKKYNNTFLNDYNFKLALALRFVFLFSFPLLSDDIYRFIWDGSQLLNGINPFAFTPTELINNNYTWLDVSLFEKMNSPVYYSVYPPINQLAFSVSAIPGKGNLVASIIILRLIIIAFDIGNLIIIKKLLAFYNKNPKLLFIYALNPLVIIEFAGNLHFEAVMIFFSLLSFWFLLQNRWILAAIALAFAVCAKLLPLIFLPLFIKQIGFKKSIYAGLICLVVILTLFLPLIYNINLAQNFVSSIQLYYGKFEFNGSIYQVFKQVGWSLLGYNPIAYTSKILITLTLIGFLISYLKTENILVSAFWMLFTYTICGAIVHPWYILFLITLTPFVKWRFAILWSVLICLSYYTYHTIPYQESLLLVIIEYILLFGFIAYEVCFKKLPLKKIY
ncbi:hypothetical protein [Pedobacter alpinus]|uniref:Mannosyltransferase n=1 Tax=Pedobacter alpinus TaxID=1590643 RepID=A0ABW5TV87_9SPHI